MCYCSTNGELPTCDQLAYVPNALAPLRPFQLHLQGPALHALSVFAPRRVQELLVSLQSVCVS